MNTITLEMHVTIIILNNAVLQWENNKASKIIALQRRIKQAMLTFLTRPK